MWARFRSAGPFGELGGHEMSPMRFEAFGQETFGIRLQHCWGRGEAGMFRPTPFLRSLRHWQTPFALSRVQAVKYLDCPHPGPPTGEGAFSATLRRITGRWG